MAYLVLMSEGLAGTKYMLEKSTLSIGRSPECDIYLDDPSVSFCHAVLDLPLPDDEPGQGFWLRDSNSTNGTYVNNEKIERHALRHNDCIVIGLSSLKFVDEQQTALDATQQIKKSWIPGVFYLKDRA